MRLRNDDVKNIPDYDLDQTGSAAPLIWYGSKTLDGTAEPWFSAPLGSQYLQGGTAYHKITNGGATTDWVSLTNANNVLNVNSNDPLYPTLSAALAAITDASDSNEYLIVVWDEVAETAAITAKDYVNVLFMPGASVMVISASTLNAVNMLNLTHTVWAAVDRDKPHIIRAGAVGAASHGLFTSGCGAGVILHNLYINNVTTGFASCHGIYNYSSSSPTMTDCTGVGGAGGTSCHGIYNYSSSSPSMTGCTGVGGAGGTFCHGIVNTSSSSPSMTSCTGVGGGVIRNSASATVPATSRQEDAFRPGTGYPYRLVGVYLNVTVAAAAGVTLTLRDATGGLGNPLSGAITVDTTGAKYFPITGHRVIANSAYVYAWLSATDATLAYTVYYAYEKCFTTCYGLYQDSDAACRIAQLVAVSNAASAAVYVTANGVNLTVFEGGVARSGLNSGVREKALSCAVAWNPGQVYNMVLEGGSTNLTAAAGTANGTNVEL